ncbi:MAG: hypothetical protein R3B70_42575 [Polyangiaceae bacterium]
MPTIHLEAQVSPGELVELRDRLTDLDTKREAETLTPAEHAELLKLVDVLDRLDAVRVQSLARLAAIRGVSLPVLMGQLGLSAPQHG